MFSQIKPGSNGIPLSVYKKLWPVVGNYIVNSWNYGCVTGTMAPSHRESILALIPKEGKDPGDIECNEKPFSI